MNILKSFPSLFIVFLLSSSTLIGQSILGQSETYILSDSEKFELSKTDIDNWLLLDQNINEKRGIGHVYLQQTVDGIPVDKAIVNLTLDAKGDIRFANSTFISGIHTKVKKGRSLKAEDAVKRSLTTLGLNIRAEIKSTVNAGTLDEKTIFKIPEISREDITAQLVYLDLGKSGVVLHWRVEVYLKSSFEVWEVYVSADDGSISVKRDQVLSCDFGHPDTDHTCVEGEETLTNISAPAERPRKITAQNPDSYNVYPMPIESPNHGSRSIVTDPADVSASPYGWHDTDGTSGAEYTITRGNNVYAQEDRNSNNGTGFSPDGGASLDFDFPINFTQAPSTYDDAAITNLFYWNNIIHDVMYQYGFDEAAGNFQENNYGKGGSGGDYVFADAQDGQFVNNAHFFSSADGASPRMQMYLWNAPNPDKDGDFDNGIIAHEYGHGISNRLTGGRLTSGCLSNDEQAGEGWSDFFGLVLTHEAGDTRTTSRGIGTYALNQSINGVGIRQYPYTTDMSVNPHTYDDIKTGSIPHGVGSVMCVTLWDMYWDFIDAYGYDPDIYGGSGGNNMALQLVMDGLASQPCSPGFMDVRDAILAADAVLYNGDNACLIWATFARRGMGFSAIQGSSNNRSDGTEAFDVESSVDMLSNPDKTAAKLNEVVTFTIDVTGGCPDQTNVIIKDMVPAGMTYVPNSASDSGVESGGVITWPTVASFTEGSTLNYTFQATMNTAHAPPGEIFNDDMESGGGNWTTSNASSLSNWTLTSSPGSFAPGTTAWFATEPEADPNVFENQYLVLDIDLTSNAMLQFSHTYDTETNWDGGRVEISTDGGVTWTDLGPFFTANGYNDYIRNNPSDLAFSGSSGGYLQSEVDLSSFCGAVSIRFNFYYDQFAAGNGWYVDDVNVVSDVGVINTAELSSDQITLRTDTDCISALAGALPVTWTSLTAVGNDKEKNIKIKWSTGTEINNKGFFVQRRSYNKKFEDLMWMEALSNSTGSKNYSYIDSDVRRSERYEYRIKQIDHDGQDDYSHVVSAQISGDAGVKIYPNPVARDESLFVEWPEEHLNEDASVQILDVHGKRLKTIHLSSHATLSKISIDGLVAGIYFVEVTSINTTITKKIIIK